MKKIKTYIIHKLGGLTPEDCAECCDYKEDLKYLEGQIYTAALIKTKLKSMNGMPADQWCKEAWEFVDQTHKNAIESY